jgi:hypothetical protein
MARFHFNYLIVLAAVDDCRKCQTATATPAEPGDLLWMLAAGLAYAVSASPRRRCARSSPGPV